MLFRWSSFGAVGRGQRLQYPPAVALSGPGPLRHISATARSMFCLMRARDHMAALGGRGEDIALAPEVIDSNDSKSTLCYHLIQHPLDQGAKLILGHGCSHRFHPWPPLDDWASTR